MDRKVFILLISLGIVLAGAAWIGSLYYQTLLTELDEPVAVVREINAGSPSSELGGPFSLVDQDGVSKTDVDFKGKYMLVYFGYSFCPDVCPTGLYAMTEALNALGPQADEIQPLFITVDPERDTPRHLKTYLKNYHPKMIALTGSKEQVTAAKKAYKVYAAKAEPDGTSTDYLMDHSSVIYVMDRQGRFVTHFNHATPVEEMVRVLTAAVK